MARLGQAPKTWPAEAHVAEWLEQVDPKAGLEHTFSGEGVRPVFYEGLPWQGKPTRVFAWYGLPERAGRQKTPAMVLAHGGGGTAFDEWVRQWTLRGYAAIAMDLTGSRPGGKPGGRPRHEWGGPPHEADIANAGLPPEEQWVYHAVADVILAHSLLRSFETVDPGRIGLAGISWGGFLSAIVPAVDKRFALAAPIYGCGFLRVTPKIGKSWAGEAHGNIDRWESLWDPMHYAGEITCPTLWVNGANDPHFPLDLHSRTVDLCVGEARRSIRVGLLHSHVHGWRVEETYAFADELLREKTPLPRVVVQGFDGDVVWASVDGPDRVAKAFLVHAGETGPWEESRWREATLPLNEAGGRIEAGIPAGARRCFINLEDARGLTVSTAPFEVEGKN